MSRRDAGQQHTGATGDRKELIERALRDRGFQMAHGLAIFDGDEGHPIVDLATGEIVDPPDDEVLELATEWSLLEGAFIS